jgi:hypothetical protein
LPRELDLSAPDGAQREVPAADVGRGGRTGRFKPCHPAHGTNPRVLSPRVALLREGHGRGQNRRRYDAEQAREQGGSPEDDVAPLPWPAQHVPSHADVPAKRDQPLARCPPAKSDAQNC